MPRTNWPKAVLVVLIALSLVVAGVPVEPLASSPDAAGGCCTGEHDDAPAPEDPLDCHPDECGACGLSCCGKSLLLGLRIEPQSLEELSGRAEAAAPAAPHPAPSRGIDRPPRA